MVRECQPGRVELQKEPRPEPRVPCSWLKLHPALQATWQGQPADSLSPEEGKEQIRPLGRCCMKGLGLRERRFLAISRGPGVSGFPSTDGVSGVRAAEGVFRHPSP